MLTAVIPLAMLVIGITDVGALGDVSLPRGLLRLVGRCRPCCFTLGGAWLDRRRQVP
ncbi:hypothetical protein Scel_62910 [Streptomyces cellostaticus]|nr:hypothetical protein Scel_62910 [Streptomyces cellostaticus]